MIKNIRCKFFVLLIVVIGLAFGSTVLAETENIILESSVQNVQLPVEMLPTFTANLVLPTIEQAEAMFDLGGGVRETLHNMTRVSSGERKMSYFPSGYVIYERENISDMSELINCDLYAASEFDGSWLKDGGQEAAFMSRDDAQKLIEEYLKQYGLTGWDNNIALYYIGMDDWRWAIDYYADEGSKDVSIKDCKEIYYAVITLSYDGINFDDREYMLLNERNVFASAVYMMIDENGILDAEFFDCYGANEISQDKPLLEYDEAVDVLDGYYDGMYINRKISVCEAKFIFTAYPLSKTEYEIVPTWRFGIRGFAEGADYIREYVRIDATNGRILE